MRRSMGLLVTMSPYYYIRSPEAVELSARIYIYKCVARLIDEHCCFINTEFFHLRLQKKHAPTSPRIT